MKFKANNGEGLFTEMSRTIRGWFRKEVGQVLGEICFIYSFVSETHHGFSYEKMDDGTWPPSWDGRDHDG